MKSTPLLTLLFVVVFARATPFFGAPENRYDVVAKTITPFLNIFAKEGKTANRALSAELVIEKMTGLAPEMGGAHAVIAIQSPDKLSLRGPVLDQHVTLCRNGKQIWAFPGAKLETLMNSMDLPEADPTFKLAPFQLPIPEKQLPLLSVLLQVVDVGQQTIGDQSCRVLDLTLMPELARAMKATQWTMRLWIRPDYTPARIEFRKPKWHASVAVKSWRYLSSLPAETWEPTSEEAGDILRLTPARYKQLLDAVTGQ